VPRELPSDANLEYLKKQAKAVLRVARRSKSKWKLADAQHAIARGFGFPSWPALKQQVETLSGARTECLSERNASRAALRREDALDPHSIAGIWISNDDNQRVIIDIAVAGETITLTQVLVTPSGDDIALKTAFHADGRDHAAEYGHGHIIQAWWSNAHLLEAVFKTNNEIIGRSAYEVSSDKQTLSLSGNNQVMLFRRLQEVQ
jgi:hypothetical protein